jgi:hypothetical protein
MNNNTTCPSCQSERVSVIITPESWSGQCLACAHVFGTTAYTRFRNDTPAPERKPVGPIFLRSATIEHYHQWDSAVDFSQFDFREDLPPVRELLYGHHCFHLVPV